MKKTILAATICAILLGCVAHAEPRPLIDFDNAAFNRARTAWEAQGITCYVFEASGAQWEPWLRITVAEGEVAGFEIIEDLWTTGEERIEDFAHMRKTIPDVFGMIQDMYDTARAGVGSLSDGQFYFIDVTYNAERHFPEAVHGGIGSYTTPPPIGGGGRRFLIREFLPQE